MSIEIRGKITRNDAKEAARLLLAAGIPREQITIEALLVADLLIEKMNSRLAEEVVRRFFPDWTLNENEAEF